MLDWLLQIQHLIELRIYKENFASGLAEENNKLEICALKLLNGKGKIKSRHIDQVLGEIDAELDNAETVVENFLNAQENKELITRVKESLAEDHSSH